MARSPHDVSRPAMVVFSSTVSAEELRAILASGAPPSSCAGARPLVDLAPHLHLTLDALHTLPELGFAEVVTTDACLADAFEFDNAAVIDLASRTKMALVRSAIGGAWQRAGVEACGPDDEALLPPLLTDADVPPTCTPLSTTLPAGLPLSWRWASQVVLGGDAAEPSAPSDQPQPEAQGSVAGAPLAYQQLQLTQGPSEASLADAATVLDEEGDVPWGVSVRPHSFTFVHAPPSSSSSSSSPSSSGPLASGVHAALRAASFTASADGQHLRLSAERRQACLARLAQCLALVDAAADEVAGSAAMGGAGPCLPRVASAAVLSH